MSIPLILKDLAIGTLNCFTKEPRDFREDEVRLVQDFADQAVVALENARAFEELRTRSIRNETLRKVLQEITQDLDL